MEFLYELGLFFFKALIVLFVIGGIAMIIGIAATKSGHRPDLEVEILNKRWDNFRRIIQFSILDKKDLKKLKKQEKEKEKKDPKERVFVLDFKGDVRASQTEEMAEEINSLLSIARTEDEVVVRLESPGGMVHGYGFAASQLLRIRDAGIKLTITVDKVAASGGYLMACTANQILAAPFAIIGSIGVVAQIPNFYKVLKKHDVEVKEYTAGEFKRTVTMFGEIDRAKEEKLHEQLTETHLLFKSFVSRLRPSLNIEQVATGEHWYGEQAIAMGLVDKIQTSDAYLLEASKKARVIHLDFHKKEALTQKLSGFLGHSIEKAVVRLLETLTNTRYF
ncbi:MAG: protease SohB [Bdellovibrionota bacterium]